MEWYVHIIYQFWLLFVFWIKLLFVIPFQNGSTLWILIPIWISWLFAEIFQEKASTSMGNAISNSMVVLWGAIDCARQTIRFINLGTLHGFWNIFVRFFILAIIFAYGALIVYFGIKGNKIIKKIGRVREVTYVFAIIVPVIYNIVHITWQYLISVILFFPLFYYAVELLNKKLPNPKAIIEDEEESKTQL